MAGHRDKAWLLAVDQVREGHRIPSTLRHQRDGCPSRNVGQISIKSGPDRFRYSNPVASVAINAGGLLLITCPHMRHQRSPTLDVMRVAAGSKDHAFSGEKNARRTGGILVFDTSHSAVTNLEALDRAGHADVDIVPKCGVRETSDQCIAVAQFHRASVENEVAQITAETARDKLERSE